MSARKRKSFTIKQKLNILKDLDGGKTRNEVIQAYGISQSTLTELVKRKSEINLEVEENPNCLSRKRFKNVKDIR